MNYYLLIKAFHIIAVVAWFAGLFYLPRLFVYHAEAKDEVSIARFKVMERRLYYGITWPAAILTTLFGALLIMDHPEYYLKAGWMHAKLSVVFILWIYHFLCGHYVKIFSRDHNRKQATFYRIFNECPTILLIVIVLLVVLKPF